MKLILSRKGFDSAAGGVPSPILPDGRLIVLPIPDDHSLTTYGELAQDGEPLGPLVGDLTRGRLTDGDRVHLDPDLLEESLPRPPGWRPLFGQMGQAQGHLRNQGVGPGDLFLFFGLFRAVATGRDGWAFVPEARPRHVLWGWMQVERVLPLDGPLPAELAWVSGHPHCQRRAANNVLYVARRHLALDGLGETLPGAGIFSHDAPALRLTAPDAAKVSDWRLPAWCYPHGGRAPLSYHADPGRWRRRADGTELRAVARGQEFVLDAAAYPEALPWAGELIRDHAARRASPAT
ncbi:hypothetical protein [Halomonas denitrificans]|uniref:Nmad3 family putative nucleotide modification protein n=1 Tax=Halomonas denitrificans TaxID=370769 RepID=UPI000D343658|nr:hypothetical protein [Halomonas denitrificans]